MKQRAIKTILIANRGEIAVRIIRTCKELGIRTVAVYSDADRSMPHVLQADEAYRLGPPPSNQSYLLMDRIIEVATAAGADAVHPGYGFLSENAVFAERVTKADLVFIGPDAHSIRAMGDKTEARKLVSAARVPTVPGTPGAVSSETEAAGFCKSVGFPVLIKAAAGGGGKGMRVVHNAGEFASAFASAQSEAQSAFGDNRVYVEKYLEKPRHVEFQILGDRHGTVIHLGERECSIQRRHQKLIEETPSVIVDDDLRQRMGETAVLAARSVNYHNAGTIEFLVDKDGNFYFLEMNTRLQVEHPITELRTGIDLVAQQIRIAMGEPLGFKQEDIEFRGHAIECRICAEDPTNNFLPSTGTIAHLKPPQGIGIREDRGIDAGGTISVYYDPMISKLVAWGQTRNEAINRMKRALHEYEILGVKTNIPALLFILNHRKFTAGDFDTHFIQHHYDVARLPVLSKDQSQAAAIVCAYLESRGHSSEGGTSSLVSDHSWKESTTNSAMKTRRTWKDQRTLNQRG
ncbi:MAG: acetyl-CoA carboxylase biotin carboxylase subunit [Bacteroidota bacterium]